MTTPVPGLPPSRAASSAILLSRYRSTQATIAERVANAIVGLWNHVINPAKFAETWEQLNPVVQGIIETHYQMSAAEAAQFYANSRVLAGFPAVHVPGKDLAADYLDRVVQSMGQGQFFHYLKEAEPDQASTMARDGLRGAGTRMTLLGGRDTITQAAVNDPVADGWERVITAGACGFCSMLAGRGGVYSEKSVNFRAHDHCHCVARPVFQGQKSVNADLSEAWGEVTKGHKGAAARAAWETYWSSHGGPESGSPETATEKGTGNAPVAVQRFEQPAIPNQ
jgi:hypothetical protein